MLICCITLITNAQKTINVKKVDSPTLINNGIELFEKGDFDGAIAQYMKVPAGDPYYDFAKYEIAYAQYEKKDYQGTIASLQEIIDSESPNIDKWQVFLMLGDSYNLMGQGEKTLEIFDLAFQSYPYSWELYYSKGVTLYNMKRYEEAKQNIAKAIFINPGFRSAHYYYGLCNLKLGYTIPGILALNYSAAIQPETSVAVYALQELDAIYSNGIDLYNKDNDIVPSPEYEAKNEFYADITAMLNTTFATLPGFHNLSKIKHRAVASNQVVFSEVKQRPGSCAIEDQLYVPTFTKIMENKQYNTFTYYEFSGTDLENGKVRDKAKKMSSAIIPLVRQMSIQLEDIASHGLGIENPGDTFYVYDDLHLSAWGVRNPNRTDEVIEEGTWHTINSNGQLETIGFFVNGKPNGPAAIFKNNLLQKESNLKDGKMTGIMNEYAFEPFKKEKVLIFTGMTSSGQFEGDFKAYNKSGILTQEGTMSSDHYEGEIKKYNDQGNLFSIENYKAGEPLGPQKYFHDNGQVASEYVVGNKNERTYLRYYHPNGKLSEESELMNMNRVGLHKTYYPNGALETSTELDDEGNANGEHTEYYRNGIKCTYSASLNDPTYYYHHDGQICYSENKHKGQVTSITTYYADSTVRQTYPLKGKNISFDIFYNNVLYKTLNVNAKNEKDGTLIDYYPNGAIARKSTYKNNQLDGPCISYYENGKLKRYTEYTNDARNGYDISYFNNAQNSVDQEGIYRNDTIFGAAYQYNIDGNVEEISYYDNNGLQTYHCFYYPNGDKSLEIRGKDDLVSTITSYGKSNQVIAIDSFYNGNGIFKQYYLNGAIKRTCPMVANALHGEKIDYDFQGNVISKSQYISNEIDGDLKEYGLTGILQHESHYILGKADGIVKNYNEVGTLANESFCELNQYQGVRKEYYCSGKLLAEKTYMDDQLYGLSTYYAPDGTTILYEIRYYSDLPVSYSCMQQNGKMSEFAPIGSEPLTITAYYPNGKVGAIVNYNNGMLNGSRSFYYSNGQAATTVQFKDDQFDGKSTQYYPNGKVCRQIDFTNDMINGQKQYFYDNGQVQYEATYQNDVLHGDINLYDRNGKLTRTIKVHYGTVENDLHY